MFKPALMTASAVLLLSNVSAAQPVMEVDDLSCTSINKAIQSLPESGGTIKLPAGEIDCTEPIRIDKSNVTLIGRGRGDFSFLPSTKIIMHAGLPAPVLVIGALEVEKHRTERHGDQFYPIKKVTNVVVKDLAVDGNRDRSIPLLDKECFDLENNVSKSCADDGGRYVRNNGITIRHAEDVTIENVAADRCYSGGMVLEKKSARIHVNNFVARDNAFDGFAGYESHSSTFKNIYLLNNAMSGISIDFEFEPSKDPALANVFTGNVFDGVYLISNGDNGIFSHSLGGNVFKNIYMINNGNFGIYIDGIRRHKRNADGSESQEWEMLEGTCDNNQFSGIIDLNSGNSTLRINHHCKKTTVKDLTSLKKESNKCLDLFDGSVQVKTENLNCVVNPDIQNLPLVKTFSNKIETTLRMFFRK